MTKKGQWGIWSACASNLWRLEPLSRGSNLFRKNVICGIVSESFLHQCGTLICKYRPVSDHMAQIVGRWYEPAVLSCRLILGLNPHPWKLTIPEASTVLRNDGQKHPLLFSCTELISFIPKIEAIIMQACRWNWKSERAAFVTFSKVWLRLPESFVTVNVIPATVLSAACTNQTGMVLDMLI